jgi:hypothetical protein
MGHDMTAYLGRHAPDDPTYASSRSDLGEEIAYLCGHYGQYEALDAQKYDAGVSGGGIGRWFNRSQLQAAKDRLSQVEWKPEYEGQPCHPAVEFLEKCLNRLPPDQEWVYIDFG